MCIVTQACLSGFPLLQSSYLSHKLTAIQLYTCRGAFIKQRKLLFAFSIGSQLLFAFSIGRLMNIKLSFSICLLNLGLLSQFNSDFVVPNRSPKEVQNQTSFGLLFDSGIEKANEVEFASN